MSAPCFCAGCERCQALSAERAAGLEPEPFVGMISADLAVPTIQQVGKPTELVQGRSGRVRTRVGTKPRSRASGRGGRGR